ncbi:MAG: lysophospholipid acyltransferase family protein [Bacteroidales bacterium]
MDGKNYKLLTNSDIIKATGMTFPGSIVFAKALMQVLKLNRVNNLYSLLPESSPIDFVNITLEQLQIRFELKPEELEKIPETGSFIAIANHPYGGIDSLLMVKAIYEKRPDIKIMANYLLKRLKAVEDIILPVNPFDTAQSNRSSYEGLKAGLNHLAEGHCVGIFPAGEVSTWQCDSNVIVDKEWNRSVLKFIQRANVPVIPIYFHGTNSRMFHFLGRVHPVLRTARLPSELFNKKDKTIQIRIGSQISIPDQARLNNISEYGRYLRAKIYSLGTTLENGKTLSFKSYHSLRKEADLIKPIPKPLLLKEIDEIRKSYELFSSGNYCVICAPASLIPGLLTETGRLRELTFRLAGEGTGKNCDTDDYDSYYHHLIMWDTEKERIAGGYRIGKGREIIERHGIKGLYVNSLFEIKDEFEYTLRESIELGRSFVTPDYQRRVLPLYLLWKGILCFLIKNPEYRYLYGPVSISKDISEFSKKIIIEFTRKYYFNHDLSSMFTSRRRFHYAGGNIVDSEILIAGAGKDINRLESIINDVQPGFRMPVLLKKYLSLNAKILGFNIDPGFNNCLDGLMFLDMYDIPEEFIKSLSKEIKDPTLTERFTKTGAFH